MVGIGLGLNLASVNGSQPLAFTPSSLSTKTAGTQTFTATGGQAPYTFTLPTNNSGGSITTHATTVDYTAGNVGSVSDVIRVTDNLGTVVNVTISVADSTPTDIFTSTNNTLWIDPQVHLTNDQSGNGNNPSSTTAVTSGTVGGKTTSNFNGTTSIVNWTGDMTKFVTATAGFIAGALVDNGSTADASHYYSDAPIFGDFSSASGGYVGASTSATLLRCGIWDGAAQEKAGGTSITGGTAFRFFMYWDSTGAGKIFVAKDGTTFDAGTAIGAGGMQSTSFAARMGVSSIGSAPKAKMDLLQLVVGKVVPTAGQVARLDSFIKNHCGL